MIYFTNYIILCWQLTSHSFYVQQLHKHLFSKVKSIIVIVWLKQGLTGGGGGYVVNIFVCIGAIKMLQNRVFQTIWHPLPPPRNASSVEL